MDTILEWVGTLLLLGVLLVIVPVFFMLIITLQFRLIGRTGSQDSDYVYGPRGSGADRSDDGR